MSTELSTSAHFAPLENAADIARRREYVLSQYKAFKDALVSRRADLNSILQEQNFYRDADELERWIADRMQQATDGSWRDTSNLEASLQRHGALEAEVQANKGSLTKLDNEGKEMMDNEHKSSENIKARLASLHNLWDGLLKALELRGIRLQQAFSLVTFLHRCDEVLYWIKDKESIVGSTEIGYDLDHVNMLRVKFDEFSSELQGFGDRVKDIREEANKMVEEENHPESEAIRKKEREVLDEWELLNEKAKDRNKALIASTRVHKFKRDVEETILWMKEKELMLQSDDMGSDVASVQKLQRNHDNVERDLAALEEKVTLLCNEADKIQEEYGDISVNKERTEVSEKWEHLKDIANQRKTKLKQNYDLQRFLADCHDIMEWSDNMEARMTADEITSDVNGAEALVDKHQEHRGEIEAQESTFSEVINFGEALIDEGHPAATVIHVEISKEDSSSSSSSSSSEDESSERPVETRTTTKPGLIPEYVNNLRTRHESLLRTWEERQALYDQCLHLALFNRDAEQAETWVVTQEALLAQDDLGDSLDSVLTLRRKHDDFTRSAAAQEEKINSVDETATRLINKGHYASTDIEKRRDELLERHAALKKGIEVRQTALEDAYKFHSFQRDIHNLCSWIDEKNKIATDESYKDPSNIRGKLQRHQIFEEEVQASEERVQSCMKDAQALVDAEHYASDKIKQDAENVEVAWKDLLEKCKERGEKLSEACAEQAFNRTVADMHRWINDVENALKSEDYGKDVATVAALIKKHQLLEVDVQVHKERIDGIEVQANNFVDEKHFNCDDIKHKQEELASRYKSLQEPMAYRREKLAESRKSKQLFRDIQDELEWIQDKRPIATSTDIGKDLMSVKNLEKKHQIVQSEIASHESQINDVCHQANKLVEEGHFEAQTTDEVSHKLKDEWEKLKQDADQRRQDLSDALDAQKYLADANDADSWIEEKKIILSSQDVGADEDSAVSLIKKHEALMSDVDSYEGTIQALHKQAEECKLQCPWEKEEKLERVLVVYDYREKFPRELTVRKGEVLSLVSAYNPDWWKVENDERKGFVPSACLKRLVDEELKDDDESDEEGEEKPVQERNTLIKRQQDIETAYDELKVLGRSRITALEHSRRRHALTRECDDLMIWMEECKTLAETYNMQVENDDDEDSLEQVEKLQKKLDDFQKDLKAREKRVDELNAEAKDLGLEHDDGSSSSSSSSESGDENIREDMVVAEKVKPVEAPRQMFSMMQIASLIKCSRKWALTKDLNEKWISLHQVVKEQNDKLGSAHQVQRFFRDADETRDWIDEKSEALNIDNVGSDLPTVQALQRKHEGLERDLVVLGERVHGLNADATTLSTQHPDQDEPIQNKQTEINQAWNDLVAKAESRKRTLSDSYDLQRFLADCNELGRWVAHTHGEVSSVEVADDIPGAEALLQRHQEHRADMDARSPSFNALESQADALVQAEHPAAAEIDSAIQKISRDREELEKAWATRRILLEQCLTLHLFLRDCNNAENWMKAREAFLVSDESGDILDSVESLITKHEDFDRAIGLQETKMDGLQSSAKRLTEADPEHYAQAEINNKAEEVQTRWLKLKAALIEQRSRLGETQTLQQFSRDADEADAWITDKLQTAMDSSYKDPTNIQNIESGLSKHQKHQAFEAELNANKERIDAVISMGQQLIDTHQCAGSEEAVQTRIQKLQEDWDHLLSKSSEKGEKLKEANQQQNFITAVKDLDFWMSEVEALLASEDMGKDVPSVSNLLKKQKLLEADVAAHEDRARDLTRHAESLLEKANESDALDQAAVEAKRDNIEKRFVTIKDLTKVRRGKLQESLVVHQLLRDIADEESWINEKKLLVSNDDCGKDLTSVNNLRKKQKRIELEINSHEPNIERILESGNKIKEEASMNKEEIGQRLDELTENWKTLKNMSDLRSVRLSQAQSFQQFRADLDEESSWMNEQLGVLGSQDQPNSLATAQTLLGKHEAFEMDLKVHRDRVSDVEATGHMLMQEENPLSDEVEMELKNISETLEKLDSATTLRQDLLRDTSDFLQFNWKADLVEAWIREKEQLLKSEDCGDDLSSVQALLVKQVTFEASLDAFEQEGIAKITILRDQLVVSDHAQSDAIKDRHSTLMERWNALKSASKVQRERLEKTQQRLKGVNDLYLLFAKKASAFNSWFENVEEDLSDPVQCHSIMEIQALLQEHGSFRETLGEAKKELKDLFDIDDRLQELDSTNPALDSAIPNNPYTWFTRQTVQETWNTVERMVDEREADLQQELGRQKDNDIARKKFAEKANTFHDLLTSTRATMVEESGTLESQLEATKLKSKEVKEKKDDLQEIEILAAALEEALILDNAYTEHSALGLAQQWNQLEQLGMRMQHNLEQQIQARNMTGVTEEALKEFSMMFKHFDKDKTGRLEHHEFKSCLRSLGYDLPMVEEGADDPEFQAILDMVDPNRDGCVSLQEYMGFMISRETENVKSSEEVESAFGALSAEGKAYVTKEELYQNLSREQAEYCVSHMPPYYDQHGINILGAYDYVAFTQQLFNN
ncbi:spectrin alpha chain, non-erythrocytic 1-like isoform X2 [Clavelina lepadiformis]|uniref:spectrin alpha chain, non-erythrocytic 1-like isoform X2 n=1 Tax=Clavelina lepadiformis TaxID=159417 RepID=UPI0040412E6B